MMDPATGGDQAVLGRGHWVHRGHWDVLGTGSAGSECWVWVPKGLSLTGIRVPWSVPMGPGARGCPQGCPQGCPGASTHRC